MSIRVTQNFYSCSNFSIKEPTTPALQPSKATVGRCNQEVENITKKVTQEAKSAEALNISPTKRWLAVAVCILIMVAGLSLAIGGALTADPLMSQLGSLLFMSTAGVGAKAFEFSLAGKL